MSKSETLTIRLDPELRRRVDEARSAMPYKPNITAMVERGLQLAIAEMELIAWESEGIDRLRELRSMADRSASEAPATEQVA